MNDTIRILNVEDVPTDSELAQREIQKVLPSFDFRRVETREEYLKALDEFNPHIVVSDYNLPTFNGLSALRLLLERTSLIPLIIFTGSLNEDIAVECMKAGATDYVIKEHVKRLGAAVVNALEQNRVKIEKELARAEALEKQKVIEKIAGTIPMGIYIYDLETNKYLFTNRYLARALGYKPEELFALGPGVPEDIVHPEDIHQVRRTAQQYRQVTDIEVLSCEYRVKDKNGTWHWIQAWEVITERFENGDPWQVLGATRDVTEKRNYEEIIRRNELKYRSIFENIQDVYYEVKPDGFILEMSPSISTISKYKRKEILGKNLNDYYMSVDDRNKFLDKLQKNHFIKDYEINLKDKDNTIIPCAITVRIVKDENDNTTKMTGIMRDIRERKKNEEHIRLQSNALESAANAIVITDNFGTIQWTNNAFTILTGYKMHEIIGANPKILNSNIQDASFYKKLWNTILQGNVWKGEIINRRKNKELYTEEMTITPVKNTSGNITHFIAIKNDITERKKAETELVRAKEKAEESDRLKTVFLQNLSHEIRTPMNAIIGFSDLLEINKFNNEKLTYCTHIIKEKSHDLLGIINEILDISLIEAGQMPVTEDEIAINNILDELLDFYQAYQIQIEKKDIVLEIVKVPNHFAQIFISDKTKLTQIFNNLINNAFKFTDTGSIQFGFHSMNESSMNFFVKDTGMGISPDKQSIVFERFRQADEGATRKKGGVGLGLSIVKGLVALLEGNIWLSSEPEKGSTFYFRLPLHLPEKGINKEVTVEPVMNRIQNKSILIVEDDYYNLDFILTILTDEGGRITTARSGHETKKKIKTVEFLDFVLLDIGLPDINGLELIPEIRSIYPAVVIIALTAYATPADREKCLKAGCNDYLSKPIDMSILIRKINSYC